jgi:peptidoglycan hydrolase-like protein with peptidoglycan-binding domain
MPTLRQGSSGGAVVTLQHDLAAKGFSPGVADGVFGPHTNSAVRAFQSSRHLAVDGIVGPQTWNALTH